MTGPFEIQYAGSALGNVPAPTTPRNVPVRGGDPNPSAAALRERFGAAILISVIDGSLQALAASQRNDSGGTTVQLSPTGSRDVMTEILKNTVAIPPTVVKNQGDRIQVLVARDVDFRPVYALRTSAQN